MLAPTPAEVVSRKNELLHSGRSRQSATGSGVLIHPLQLQTHDRPDRAALFTNLSPKVIDRGAVHGAAKRTGLRVFPTLCGGAGGPGLNALVRLETTQGVARFTNARSGSLLAEVPLKDDAV